MKKFIIAFLTYIIFNVISLNAQPYYGLGGYLGSTYYATTHWNSDAVCFNIRSPYVQPSGLSTSWFYYFRSAYSAYDYVIQIVITQGNVQYYTYQYTPAQGVIRQILDYQYIIDSDEALDIAEDEGGYYYRQTHSNVTLDAYVCRATFFPSSSIPYWCVIYKSNGVAGIYFIINAYNGTVVSIDDEILSVPLEFNLDQNYPNPFNPSTTIRYGVKERTNVNIIVFNAIGEEISELINEEKEPGAYEVVFNAANLPSGIYLYKIIAGNYINTKKMILLR
jgi:hypothetical protein